MAELAPIPHRHWPTPGEILKQIAESARGTAKWVGHHKRGALLFGTILTGTGGAIIYAVNPAFNQTVNSLPTEAAAWWNSMLRGSGSGSSVVIPETATATPKPIPTETKLTPTPEAQKPKITIMINGRPTEVVVLPPTEVQTLIDESGEFTIPLKMDKEMGIVEVVGKNGDTGFIITAPMKGTYNLYALSEGRVSGINPGGMPGHIEIMDKTSGKLLTGYITAPVGSSPTMTKNLVNNKDSVTIGQSVLETHFDPGSDQWLAFDKYIRSLLKEETADGRELPNNMIAFINASNSYTLENALKTNQGTLVTIGPNS